MHVDFLVHSQTGNTLEVAGALQRLVDQAGGSSRLTRVRADDEKQSDPSKTTTGPVPDASDADLVVVGCPVHGFSASPAILKALSVSPYLAGRPVFVYVTQAFPFDWMGGTRAVAQLERAVAGEGGHVVGRYVVHWNRKDRERQIEALGAIFREAAPR